MLLIMILSMKYAQLLRDTCSVTIKSIFLETGAKIPTNSITRTWKSRA